MDYKAIGNYLRRLRMRAGYTQSDVGEFLSVTDKAISRWENGVGVPELGNLMTLARLYKITVDDILNCNEAVFAAKDEAQQASQQEPVGAPTVAVQNVADTTEAETTVEAPPVKQPATDDGKVEGFSNNIETSVKRTAAAGNGVFLAVVLFVYLASGTLVPFYYKVGNVGGMALALNIVLAIAVGVIVAAELLRGRLGKFCKIALPVACVLAVVCVFDSMAVQLWSNSDGNVPQVLVCNTALGMLFVVWLLCSFADDSAKTLYIVAFALSSILLAFCTVCCAMFGGFALLYASSKTLLAAEFAAAVLFLYAFEKAFGKRMAIVRPVLYACAMAMFFAFPQYKDSLYDLDGLPSVCIAIACGAPILTEIHGLFRQSPAVSIVVAVASAACILPLFVYTIDILIANIMTSQPLYASASALRLVVLAGALACCALFCVKNILVAVGKEK